MVLVNLIIFISPSEAGGQRSLTVQIINRGETAIKENTSARVNLCPKSHISVSVERSLLHQGSFLFIEDEKMV